MMKERWSASAEKGKLKKGPWTFEEDVRLLRSIRIYGEGRWSALAKAAGLQRCGKSCRLRWVNYLRPDLKRGNITPEEERMIIDLHSRWGNRWSLIAEKMPGRTDNEIKNYWRCHLKKKLQAAAAAAGTTAIAAANSMHDKAVEDRNSYRPSNINPYKMMTTEGLQSQIGSNHSHSPSYGQNSSMNMDCSQTGPDTFALLSPPLPVPAEPKTELSEQHQAAAAAACSSSSLESDHKSEAAEEPGLPPLAVPRFLCRLGSGIPLIEELATLNIAAAAADHHQRLCNANAAASEILLHHHPHHHQQQHPHHNPHHHQQQPEPQDCCEFDSGIEIDLAGDSMLWSVYPFLPVATPTHHHHHHEGATPEAASASVSASSRWFDDAMAPSPPPLLHPHHP